MRIWQVGLLGLALGIGAARAQEPLPRGDEFQVNSYTTNNQSRPEVATDADGNFVVVWQSRGSFGTDTDYSSIQGQRYDAEGNPFGGEFQVNSYTTGRQKNPDVAMDTQGDFVVIWRSPGSFGTDSSGYSVQGQRYDASGAPVGSEFQVNSYTTSSQYFPNVAIDAQGNFVVVWQSYGSYGTDTDESSIQGQRYDAEGDPFGGEFQVNSYTTSSQYIPNVAIDAQGNFVVVWQSYGSSGTDRSSGSIQAQRYAADGTPAGGQFQVNSYTTSWQGGSAVATDTEGDFVVVWSSYGSYGTDTDYSIQAQRYDASGGPVGSEFQVNSYTTSYQVMPEVAADAQGDFVVVWESRGSYGTDTDIISIQGRRYDTAGNPVGGQFQVNSYTTDNQRHPAVAAHPDGGDFVVAWESDGSYGTDTSSDSIQGQRYASPIFTDGFESGDTSAWTSTVP